MAVDHIPPSPPESATERSAQGRVAQSGAPCPHEPPGHVLVGVQISLFHDVAVLGSAEGDKLDNIENLGGSAFDDQLWGDDGINFLTGQGGADTLKGYAGDDTLWGARATTRCTAWEASTR